MPAYQGHLWDAQAHLKEPANRLVTQVMEMQVCDARMFRQELPGQLGLSPCSVLFSI